MWYINRVSKANSEFVASALELLQSTSRNLIVVTGGLYLIWHYAAALTWPDQFLFKGWPLSIMVILICALSLWLLPKHLLLAQAVWQVGLAGSIALAFYLYERPEILFLYVFLPLMAVVTVGRRGGLLAEGMVILLIGWFSQGQEPASLPPGYDWMIISGAAFAGVLGWAVSRTLLTVTHWSLFSFEQARKNLETANQHRGEVVWVMKALDQAYYNLERANHMLVLARAKAEAQEARDRFVLAVSHELRTPLNFIFGFSELMVNSPRTYTNLESWPPGLYDDIQKIYRSSIHLLQLVNDVLSLGQIEARQMALLKETVDLPQLVHEAESMIKPVLARKGLWFHTEIEPELPHVFVDCTRIRQVLLNLMTNSLRFTEQGGITVRLQREKETIRVCVEEDTGPGIEAEDIPKLFEEFRQVGQDSIRRREGSGLGLPISRQLVQLHGGQMWVESDGLTSQGSRFYFTLPICGASTQLFFGLDQETVEAHYRQFIKEEARRERLLMTLSPDPAAEELMARYVADYRVLTLSRPDQLRALMIQHLPSTLVVDQAIIKEKEVALVLQDLPYDLPVISFIFPGSLDRLKNLPGSVSNYLIKPVTRQVLAKAVLELGPNIRRLLVVDDDPAMVRFVTLALESKFQDQAKESLHPSPNHYQLTTAFTGQEALTRLRQDPPDALLLDLGLPDMTGWEILAQLQQEPELAHIPAIVITARDLPPSFHPDQCEIVQILVGRHLSWPELGELLKNVVETVQPVYPTLSALNGPAPPASLPE